MTLIVYRDGILAGDTAHWRGNFLIKHAPKVYKLSDGTLLGCSGDEAYIQRYVRWALNGKEGQMPDLVSMGAMEISPNRVITKQAKFMDDEEHKEPPLIPYVSSADYDVIGSHQDFAFGCLAAGKSAEETVALAIKHCTWISGEVISVRF